MGVLVISTLKCYRLGHKKEEQQQSECSKFNEMLYVLTKERRSNKLTVVKKS